MDEKMGRDLFISETRRNAMMDYTHCVNISVYPTYNTQAAVGKPAPRMAPSKETWPRVLQAGYQSNIQQHTTTATISSHAAEPLTTTAPPQNQSAAPMR
jgi:hypothetical protein